MPDLAKSAGATIMPVLRYRDAPAAIEWLCQTFGFEKHLVIPGKDGAIAHAQLSFGNGMVMLASKLKTDMELDRAARGPAAAGLGNTPSVYVVVADADVVYAKVKAVGAGIAMEIRDEDYGGRDFSCHDPEGYLWSFGTYDPWSRT
ncbi:MAG: VOC family protein [Aestuariivirga sp.]